jgi:glycerol-3-phosphate acyltransferase PlsY
MADTAVVAFAVVFAFGVGAIPFSYLVARWVAGADLRAVGSGTVSGSGVGEAVGFWPMAGAGLLDIGKGAAAVLPLAGTRPVVAAIAAGAAVIGHNWSPFLHRAGGRGISPAIGSAAVLAWPGALVLLAGLALGKLARHTSVGSFAAQAALPPVLAITDGTVGLVLGIAVVLPMWVKRVMGNRPPEPRAWRVLLYRLVRDHDPAGRSDGDG